MNNTINPEGNDDDERLKIWRDDFSFLLLDSFFFANKRVQKYNLATVFTHDDVYIEYLKYSVNVLSWVLNGGEFYIQYPSGLKNQCKIYLNQMMYVKLKELRKLKQKNPYYHYIGNDENMS